MPTRTRTISRAAQAFVTLALAASMLGGCAGKGAGSAVKLYEQGDYPGAYREAETIAAQAKDAEARDQAALVAGMSAYEMRRYDDAERWLRPVSRSLDRAAAGRAFATLGLVGVRQDRYSTAALDLQAAGRRLTGDDAAQANYFAGECYTLTGDLERARAAYNAALRSAESPALRERVGQRLATSDFTLQLGAFSSKVNADRTLALAARRAAERKFPAPTLTTAQDVAGRTIYLVRLGTFKTRAEAVSARTRLGMESAVVPAR